MTFKSSYFIYFHGNVVVHLKHFYCIFLMVFFDFMIIFQNIHLKKKAGTLLTLLRLNFIEEKKIDDHLKFSCGNRQTVADSQQSKEWKVFDSQL